MVETAEQKNTPERLEVLTAALHSGTADQVRNLLMDLSRDYHPQRALVSGHIGCRNGYRIVADGLHLRVASGAHAHPATSARYMLFDAGQAIGATVDLIEGLGSVFGAHRGR